MKERHEDDEAMTEMSDERLLTLLRSGDKSAYEVLWSRHVAAGLRVAKQILPHRAEDLVADSFFAGL